MIDKNNLKSRLIELDEQLVLLGVKEPREIVIYGGAALISMDIINRATVDIDVFAPPLDETFLQAVRILAQKYFYDDQWVNSTGKAFIHELPLGWKKRSIDFFRGTALVVKVLSREDLIYTKFLAELDRGEDLEDLKSLKPTRRELEKIIDPLTELEPHEAWAQKIQDIVKLLLRSNHE